MSAYGASCKSGTNCVLQALLSIRTSFGRLAGEAHPASGGCEFTDGRYSMCRISRSHTAKFGMLDAGKQKQPCHADSIELSALSENKACHCPPPLPPHGVNFFRADWLFLGVQITSMCMIPGRGDGPGSQWQTALSWSSAATPPQSCPTTAPSSSWAVA